MNHKITKIEDTINLSSKSELRILFNSIKPFWSKRRKRKKKKKSYENETCLPLCSWPACGIKEKKLLPLRELFSVITLVLFSSLTDRFRSLWGRVSKFLLLKFTQFLTCLPRIEAALVASLAAPITTPTFLIKVILFLTTLTATFGSKYSAKHKTTKIASTLQKLDSAP